MKARTCLLVGTTMLAALAEARAQEAPAPAAVADTPAEGIVDIVVTAQRRSEQLQDVPIAISAIDAERIRESGFRDVSDLSSRVPNLQISTLWGTSNPKLFMRGIGNNNFNQTAESKVAVYLDQVYLSAPSGQLFQVFDLERIEVLRGPQGTLYGKNATGGAIAVFSRLPGPDTDGYARASYGNYNALELEAARSVSLTEVLSARVAGTYKRRDGYVTDLRDDSRVNDRDEWAARGILRWRPEGADIVLNVHGGAADSTHNNSAHRGLFDPAALETGQFVRLSAGGVRRGEGVDILGYRDPDRDPYDNTYERDTFARIDLVGASLNASVDLGEYTLTSVSGFEQSKRHVLQEGNGAPSTIFTIDWGPSTFRQYQQELRITSPGGRAFEWIAGLFAFHEKGTVHNFYNLASVSFALGFDAFDQYYTQETDTFAAYGQASYRLNDRLKFTLGGRINYDRRTLDHETFLATASGVSILPGPFVDVDLKDDWTQWSGRAALDYEFADDVLGFLSVNRGFTSGGFNTGAFNDPIGAAEIYDPEIIVSYEAGLKTTLLDRRLRLNATGFYYDYTDLQVFRFTSNGQQFIENASDARIYGVEFELHALVTRNWELTASAGFLRSEYLDFVRGSEDLSGNRLIGSPDVQWNLLSVYTIPLASGSIALRGDLTFTGNRYYDEREFDDVSSEGGDYNLDARVTWRNEAKTFEASLWAKNLTDEATIIDVVDVGLFGYQNVWYNTPRTYGVEIGFRF